MFGEWMNDPIWVECKKRRDEELERELELEEKIFRIFSSNIKIRVSGRNINNFIFAINSSVDVLKNKIKSLFLLMILIL